MNEPIPRFGSRRFRQALFSALIGEPSTALAGLYWFVTRRRVRGWARIALAAAKGPAGYQRWVIYGEPKAVAEYCQTRDPCPIPPVILIVLGAEDRNDGETERTLDSVRAAFAAPVGPEQLGDQVTAVVRNFSGNILALIETLPKRPDGAWVMLVPAGDIVSPQLGDVLARALRRESRAALIYWDEDQLSSGARDKPWIKPDWDDLLFSQLDGLVGASVVSLRAIAEAATRRPELRTTREDVECLLRDVAAAELAPPLHVPLVLTHRAAANAPKPGRKRPLSAAIANAQPLPSVSVIIPTRDQPDLLAACLRGLRATSYAGKVELIVIDNGTRDARALGIMRSASDEDGAIIMSDDGPFNYSKLNNAAAARASGEILCLLNNDIEPLNADWLQIMVGYAMRPDVGAVGAQLLYPSGRIQHAGVAIGLGGAAGHVQKGVYPDDERHWTWHGVSREVSALTAAALVIRRDAYLEVGGFDEEAFPVAFNDVDLCLRLKARGLRNLYIAEARLIHHESESRGDDMAPENAPRFAVELKRLQERWGTETYQDPHFSPLFSRLTEQCLLVS